MANKVILLGNCGRDPEVRSLPNGDSVANFSLATNERWRDRYGNKQERTEWHNIVCFGKTADVVREYVSKGMQLYTEGKIQTRSWEDKNTGEKKYRTEIVAHVVEFVGGGNRKSAEEHQEEADFEREVGQESGADDDDIPFGLFLMPILGGIIGGLA